MRGRMLNIVFPHFPQFVQFSLPEAAFTMHRNVGSIMFIKKCIPGQINLKQWGFTTAINKKITTAAARDGDGSSSSTIKQQLAARTAAFPSCEPVHIQHFFPPSCCAIAEPETLNRIVVAGGKKSTLR